MATFLGSCYFGLHLPGQIALNPLSRSQECLIYVLMQVSSASLLLACLIRTCSAAVKVNCLSFSQGQKPCSQSNLRLRLLPRYWFQLDSSFFLDFLILTFCANQACLPSSNIQTNSEQVGRIVSLKVRMSPSSSGLLSFYCDPTSATWLEHGFV